LAVDESIVTGTEAPSSVTVTVSIVEGAGDSPTEPSARRSWSVVGLVVLLALDGRSKRGQVVAQTGKLRNAQLAGARRGG